MIAACAALALLGAGIAVDLAPDQPLPIVYIDEPLLIELLADADVAAGVKLTLAAPARTPVSVDLGTISLKAGAARWRAVEGLPPYRGLYTVRLTLDLEGQQQTHERVVCRIDRPSPRPLEWITPLADGVDGTDVQMLRTAPFAMAALPVQAAVALDPEFRRPILPKWAVHVTEASTAPGALRLAFPEAAWWIVDLPPRSAASTVQAIDAERGQAPLALTLGSPDDAAAAVETGLHRAVTHWRIPWSAAASVTQALDEALFAQGVEHMPWIAAVTPESGAELAEAAIAARRADARFVEIPFAALYRDGAPTGLLPYACALAHRLGGARYAGALDLGDPYEADVFTRDGGWIVVFRTREEPSEIRLAVGSAGQVRAFDGQNNPLPGVTLEDGEVPLLAARDFHFLEGAGGTVAAQAARYMARREAEALIDQTNAPELLPEAMVDALERAAADNIDRLQRREFLLLLQAFPLLENARRSDPAQGASALAAAKRLTRLLRHLSTVEQEAGEPFLEPYTDLLARADEMTARYVTGLPGSNRDTPGRAEWLFAEITRLGDDARHMAASGRPIEADAVASLAEWRARSLRYAMDGPAQDEE